MTVAWRMSLFAELKRRNIFRVGLLYVALAWLLVEIGGLLVELLGLPGWIHRFVFGLLVIGFPLCLVFSWIYEITPDGLKREFEVARGQSITRETGRKINLAITGSLALVLLMNLARFLFS